MNAAQKTDLPCLAREEKHEEDWKQDVKVKVFTPIKMVAWESHPGYPIFRGICPIRANDP